MRTITTAKKATGIEAIIKEDAPERGAPTSYATPSIMERVKALGRVEKPGRTARIRLNHSIDYKPTTVSFPGYSVSLDIPSWAAARALLVQGAVALNVWTSGATYLSDPFLGAVTQQRFLEKWETVLSSKEFWLNRDKGPSIRHNYRMREVI
jgi:hypothetical protein